MCEGSMLPMAREDPPGAWGQGTGVREHRRDIHDSAFTEVHVKTKLFGPCLSARGRR